MPGASTPSDVSAEFLLIDVGNSRAKLALADSSRIVAESSIDTATITGTELRRHLDQLGWQARHCLLCSVVPKVNAAVVSALGDEVAVLDAGFDLGVAIDYPDPTTIGADRLANAAALVATGAGPGVVIDFGTAVTFDIVDHRPAYIGGIIAPGLAMSTDYLAERTALLPKIDLTREDGAPRWVGRSTREAMLAGAFHGFTGMIRHLLDGLTQELLQRARQDSRGEENGAVKVRVLATGGDAGLICLQDCFKTTVQPDLTLQGLRHIACLRWG